MNLQYGNVRARCRNPTRPSPRGSRTFTFQARAPWAQSVRGPGLVRGGWPRLKPEVGVFDRVSKDGRSLVLSSEDQRRLPQAL